MIADDPTATWRRFHSLWLALPLAAMSSPFFWLASEGASGRAPGGSPGFALGVGLVFLAGAARIGLPGRRRVLRVTRTAFLVDGQPRDPRRWPDAMVIAGIMQAGNSRRDASRFVAARMARQHLAARPDGPFAEVLLRGADALARAAEPDLSGPVWPYAALIEPGAPTRVCLTPEAARVAATTTSTTSVFILAGYLSGHETALAEHGAVVRSLELIERDPFLYAASSIAHHGGALSAMDGGDLDDLAASVQACGSRTGATVADRHAVPEVDLCLVRRGPARDTDWPARLAALFAYRAVAGPRTDLEARVFAVLRGWKDRIGDDNFTAFARAWRQLMAQPAESGKLMECVTWPDGLTPRA